MEQLSAMLLNLRNVRALCFSRLMRGCFLAVLLCSCDESKDSPTTDAGELLGCEQGDLEAGEELADLAAGLSECTVDADCDEVPFELKCPETGTQLGGCTFAISKQRISEYEEEAQAVADSLCPRIVPNCRSSAQCIQSVARCIEARCTLEPTEP
jgi:hypothetical protein